MSARVLRFEGSVHGQCMRLLPWYVNGTLEDEERALVAQHLADCAECRSEIAEQQQLQESWLSAADAGDASGSFLRLRRRMQKQDRHSVPSWWGRVRDSWRQAPTWLRVTLAAQCGLVLALGGMLVGQYRGGEHYAAYRTLGDDAADHDLTSAIAQHRLVVVFDPRVDHAQMQRLLRASGARIVDGPNDAGAYVLAVPASSRAAARETLRAGPGVVLVEDLTPGVPQ
jgi:hypothetical protein